MKEGMEKNGKRTRRLSSKTGWRIAIDDGYTCYKFNLKASGRYCIDSLFRKIQKSIIPKKKRNKL